MAIVSLITDLGSMMTRVFAALQADADNNDCSTHFNKYLQTFMHAI